MPNPKDLAASRQISRNNHKPIIPRPKEPSVLDVLLVQGFMQAATNARDETFVPDDIRPMAERMAKYYGYEINKSHIPRQEVEEACSFALAQEITDVYRPLFDKNIGGEEMGHLIGVCHRETLELIRKRLGIG